MTKCHKKKNHQNQQAASMRAAQWGSEQWIVVGVQGGTGA